MTERGADLPATEALRVLEERLGALDRLVHVQIESHRSEVQQALHANEKRVGNIYTALDRIRDGLSETLTQEEYDRRHEQLDVRIGRIELLQTRSTGIGYGVSVTLGLLLAGFIALALHYFG